MKLTSRDLLNINYIEARNIESMNGMSITGVSTDSRHIRPGELFFALKGENFDGQEFLEHAFKQGAVAAVVGVSTDITRYRSVPLVLVEDTVRALGELAHLYRRKFRIPVIAIGGSNGKTSTRVMLAAVLGTKYNVLSTERNFNNHIGMPLTLFRLRNKHDVAIVEIGTNRPGEIEALSDILEPTHGLITNIGKEHLEFLRSLNGVAKEEGALFEHLKRHKGSCAFVNADDERVVLNSKGLKGRFTYGFAAPRVDLKGKLISMNSASCVKFQFAGEKLKRGLMVQLSIPGEHNAINALAAAAVGLSFRVSADRIRKALESCDPAAMRMQVLKVHGVTIYDDTYNANPDSTIAALRTLAQAKVRGNKIAVLADMRELGKHALEEHARIGKEVSQLGLKYLLTHGELAKYITEAAKLECGFHYDQKNMLAEYLAELVAPGDAVLVKGSRVMKMEDIVTFLDERLHSAAVPFGRTGTV